MRITNMTGCCVAHIISGFGESTTAISDNYNERTLTEEGMVQYLLERAQGYSRHAFFAVITNNEQSKINNVLKTLEFEHSKWMSKEQHPDTKVRLWWVHIPTLLSKIP